MDRTDWIEKATECPVLKGIDKERFAEVIKEFRFQIKKFGKNDLIASQGEMVGHLIILIQGSVRGEMTDYSGRMIKIEDIQAPKPVASAFLFGSNNYFPVDILANEPVVLLMIPREEFLGIMRVCPPIQVNYLNLVSSKAQFLSRKIQFLSLKTIRGKIAHYLLGLEKDAQGVISIPVSQQSLAELFGVARPSVARGFKSFEDDGILAIKNRKVQVIKPDALVDLLDE